MRINLRLRIFLTILPLLVLIAILGTAGSLLFYYLGNSLNIILRENFDSVQYMQQFNEAVERIDSSFQFALAGEEEKARKQYQDNLRALEKNLGLEEHNITLPGEGELVEQLREQTRQYSHQGKAFYDMAVGDRLRREEYFRTTLPKNYISTQLVVVNGSSAYQALVVYGLFQAKGGSVREPTGFWNVSAKSRRYLHRFCTSIRITWSIKRARMPARPLWPALGLFGGAVLLAVFLGGLFAWHTIKTILAPIKAVTQSALSISAGNLDQIVPVVSHDELGHLADAFNVMARQLRVYRQAHSTRLLRAQRTSQATIDSFPDPVLVIDSAGCVEMANPSACRLLGVASRNPEQPSSLPWQPPESLLPPLREALQNQRDYSPDEFDHVVLFGVNGEERSFLPRIVHNTRSLRQHARRSRIATRRHAFSTARPVQKRPGGHGQPRAENAVDQLTARSSFASGGITWSARMQANGTAARCQRKRRTAPGDRQ